MIKKLDILILKSFARPFIPTFLVMVLFFLMQMVWKYIDDLAGRGIEWYYIAELLLYWAAGVFPIALPIAILLSSLTTFGTFGENNELAAMKSAGISLFRIMRPLMVLMIFISAGAFLFYNYVIPFANLKSASLVQNISQQKPALNILPGIFNTDLDGYSIKVAEKTGPDENDLVDVLIYDHTDNSGNTKVTVAKTGRIEISEDQRWMNIKLYNGSTYEEVKAQNRKERQRYPFIKASFKETMVRFDLMQFKAGDLKQEKNKNFYMMNVNQLMVAADSIHGNIDLFQEIFAQNLSGKYYFSQVKLDTATPETIDENIIANIGTKAMRKRAIQNALRMARSNKEFINQKIREYEWRQKMLARHYLEWHKKFALSFACFVLFFIGAPLGAIIRKGGIGMPVVVSVFVFITYHIINTIFDKSGRDLVLEPWAATWLGTLILAPFGILLTYKAANDSSILSSEFYSKLFKGLAHIFRRKKPAPQK